MKVKCKNCGSQVVLNQEQIDLIEKLKNQNSSLGMLQCDNCGLGFPINPLNLELDYEDDKELVWRSPISGSFGFVSLIESEDGSQFYGCSETGVIWRTSQSFYNDIESIIEKYPHRLLFYKKESSDWFPVKDEPDNADEMIESEEQEDLKEYER